MTQKKLYSILKQTGLPVAYHHFKNTTAPPLICYLRINNDNILADDRVYVKCPNYRVELHTDEKAPEIEELLENLFDENEFVYDVDETYIESEKMYEVIYYIQI